MYDKNLCAGLKFNFFDIDIWKNNHKEDILDASVWKHWGNM